MSELLAPLAVCWPKLRDPEDRHKGRYWNFTILAASYGLLTIVGVCMLVSMEHNLTGTVDIYIFLSVYGLGVPLELAAGARARFLRFARINRACSKDTGSVPSVPRVPCS